MYTIKKLRKSFRIPNYVLISLLLSTVVVAPIVFFVLRHSARSDLRQMQQNLEARLEKFHSTLRNTRWSLTRFAFLRDHVLGKNKELMDSVESILLPGFSFDSQSDYFFLRDLNGNTKLETIRGALVARHSKLYIPNEQNLITEMERVIVSSCTIDEQPYLCLINTPDARSYLSIATLYVSVGAIAPDSLGVLAGTTSIFRDSIFEPGWPEFHFEKPESKSFLTKFDQVAEAGVGFWISIGYPWKSFLLITSCITLLLTGLSILLIRYVRSYFNKQVRIALEIETLKNQKDYYKSISSFAKGVIHDINSPLCALRFLAAGEKEVERKAVFDMLIKRIRLMITDLEDKVAGCAPKTLIFLPLDQILRSIVNEKQREYGDSVHVGLVLDEHKKVSVKGVYSDFCRMLSNIINNSVQARSNKIYISLSIDNNEKKVVVSVTDNGRGISPDNIDSVFAEGVTIGKKGGTGFGLFHAKNTITEMNGKIEVESELGKGTTVRLVLPLAEVPSWMSTKIEVPKKGSLIIVDDEVSMHTLMHRKLENIKDDITISCFNHPDEVPSDLIQDGRSVFIVDWNFGNEMGAGLKLCEQLPHKRTLLFTSEWNIDTVQHEADNLGVKLLGKEFIEALEVSIT